MTTTTKRPTGAVGEVVSVRLGAEDLAMIEEVRAFYVAMSRVAMAQSTIVKMLLRSGYEAMKKNGPLSRPRLKGSKKRAR